MMMRASLLSVCGHPCSTVPNHVAYARLGELLTPLLMLVARSLFFLGIEGRAQRVLSSSSSNGKT